ncbi:MAG: MATE family efflux transporter [archaeon]|nr:MATE family efflux transporter [archaeon]
METTTGVNSIIGEPKKALLRMSIPLIISLFITGLYNIVDAIWVSGLGADALAGVGYVMPIFIALMGIGNGLGAGSTFALSKYIGENNKKKADNGGVHAILITFLISILTTIVLLIFLKPFLILIGVGNTIQYAMEYGTIIVLGSLFIILSNSLYGILRGEGDAKRTMYSMIICSILNIVLDPIFIYYLNLGVKGAAISTILSLIIVNLILIYWFFIKKNTYISPFIKNYKYNKEISLDIIKVGVPASLELINNALFAALFSLILTYLGSTDSVAVYSTGWTIVTLATTPVLAIATALISVIAANFGKKNYKNILIAHRYSMKLGILFGAIAALIVYIFAPQIVTIFTYTGTSTRLTPQLIAFLSCIVIFFPTMGIGATSTFVFQGVGKGLTAMFQTILRETVFTLFFAILLGITFGLGEYGAWWGIVLGELVVNTITMIWADLHIKKLIKSTN